MSHETRTDPPTYPEVLDIHDGAFSESIWGSDGFKTIKVSGQSDVVADSYKDDLTIAAGSNVTITTNAAGDTVTIASTAYTAGNGLQLSGNEFSVTALAITSVHEAANQAAQLALTTQEGDIVVRADENKSYVRNAGTAGNMNDFTLLKTPTDLVLSVAGNTGAITANQIRDAVEAATDSNTFTDADHTKLNGIDTGAKDDQTSAEIKSLLAGDNITGSHIADDAIDSEHYTDGSIDHVHLSGDCVDGDNIANDSLDSEHYIDGSIDEQHIANDAVTYAKMQDVSATDRILGRDSSGAGVIEEITPANLRTMINVEDGADVTDTANVTSAGAVMKTTVDALGDLLVASADDTVTRLARGTNDHVLTADSSTGTGLKWAAIPASGDANQNAFSNVAVSGQTTIAADSATDTLTLAGAGSVTITTNATSDTVTITGSSTDATKMPLAGGTFTGDVTINDDEEIRVGSNSDLIIVHNGTDGFIKETTGTLDIRAKNTNGGLVTISDSAGENLIKCTAGSSVELTYDGTKKFETTSAGATVTGTLTATLAANSIDSDHYVDGSIDLEHLSASGTKSSSTYLRGDNTWATVSSGGIPDAGNTATGSFALDRSTTIKIDAGQYLWLTCDQYLNVDVGQYADIDVTQYMDIDVSQYFDLNATQHIALATAGTERFRITSTGALAIEGSSNYGSSGQVLTSNGNDAPTWQDAAGGGPGTGEMFVKMYSGNTASNSGTNTIAGYNAGAALTANANNNTFIGKEAGASMNSEGLCTAVGERALSACTSGDSNVAIGQVAQRDGIQALKNVSVGNNTLLVNKSGNKNTAVGTYCLTALDDADNNTAVGWNAGASLTTAEECVFIGREAGKGVTTGDYNISIGAESMLGAVTGIANVNIGRDGLRAITSGQKNVNVGNDGNRTGTSASYCASLGHRGLFNNTGNYNTAVGYTAGEDITSGSNLTCIGHSANASASDATNEITLGNNSVSTLRCQVTSISSLSDRRDKTDINTLDLGLDFINELKPVKFKWQSREGLAKDGTYEAGFIAQDFQQVQKDNDADYLQMVLESNPDKLEAAPGKLIPILVRAVQELSTELNTLKNTLNNG